MRTAGWIHPHVSRRDGRSIAAQSLHKKMRVAIGVNDDYVEKTIEAIIEGARTGDIGDGKIFVLPMEECVRIRTGERGPSAIG